MDAEDAMRQAAMTADTYMRAAVERIDALFGDGYSKANPQLVVGFMNAAALDFQAMWLAQALDGPISEVGDAIGRLK